MSWWGVGWHGLVTWKELEMKTWQGEQMFRKWSGTEGEENRNCDVMTALRDTLKVWKSIGEKHQQIENVMREKWEEDKGNGNGCHGQLTTNNKDAKTRTTTKRNLTLV